jgi:glyoxylase-like metal-dependent hydrolase (beta-lactamase superfamily II)
MTNYEVVLVRYGTRTTTRGDVFLNYHLYQEADKPIEMDYFFWVVRNAQQTVLVDTGFSAAGGSKRARTSTLEPAAAYRALGIDPADGPEIVVTHAHYDHIGNLDLFPDSRIALAQREYDFWTGPHARHVQFRHSVEEAELKYLTAAYRAGRVATFDDRWSPAPGVEVIRVGGHTPGQSVVLVQTSDGPVLLASDAVHYYEEYEREMPFTSAADLIDMYASFDYVRDLIERGSVRHLVSGHDPDTLARFRPLGGELASHAASIGTLS